jgi:hypothetical protein
MRDRTPGNCICACKGATLQLVPRFLSVDTDNPALGRPIHLPAQRRSHRTNCPQPAACSGFGGCYGLS